MLEKPDGGEFGKYYSLPALNDPRIGNLFALFFYCVFHLATESETVGNEMNLL